MAVGLSTFLRRAGVVLMMGRTNEEFDRFVDEACEPLLRAVYLIVGDASAAEDVVQETLLRVARRWPRVRRMRSPGAYARRIALNLALDEHAARCREDAALQREGIALERSEPD